ncbi:MAG TPA: zf-HC2 domain-containing protein [Candidatus Acidoferrales bacterium]|nr:zf-HC2 domain-containing protein [Candidatus Acidoferrales bacterium]
MSCNRMEHWMLEYLDGSLSENHRREADAHLETCDICRLRVKEFRAVSGILDELPPVEPSAAFDIRMQARIAAEPKRSSFLAWLSPGPRVAFAASLLLLLVMWSANRPTDVDDYIGHPPTVEEQFRMIKDLPVLEDYDVLANFEPLGSLPPAAQADQN